ncbi:unnamed protein product, partial [Symbiodinium sp. KB8]
MAAESTPGDGSTPALSQETWLRNVYRRQKSRMTPELRASIKAKAASAQRRAYRSKKAKRMMKVQSANMKSYCMSSAMMGAMDAPGSIEAQAEEAQGRMRMVQKALCQVDEEDSDGDFDAQLSLAAPVVTEGAGLADLPTLPAGPLAEVEPVDTSTDAAFQELLDKLKKEPEDSGEAGAKFKLYETFLDTVQLMRSKTLDFWEECKEDFADAPT